MILEVLLAFLLALFPVGLFLLAWQRMWRPTKYEKEKKDLEIRVEELENIIIQRQEELIKRNFELLDCKRELIFFKKLKQK